MNSIIEIACGAARAQISPFGAELKSWSVDGRPLLWPGEARTWADTAPILFPVVGWTRDGARVGGRRYPLGLHGFARHQDFVLRRREADSVLFALSDNARTRSQYPFAFELEAEFVLSETSLRVGLTATNRDEGPMPYALGVHPGFLWPLPGGRGRHVVRFDHKESADVPVITPGGLFSQKTRRLDFDGKILPLTPELFVEALCFLNAASVGLEFGAGDGRGLRAEFENFPHIALWSVPGAGFLCIEAWTGHGDPEDFAGDLFAKPSMRVLAPGTSDACAATFFWRG